MPECDCGNEIDRKNPAGHWRDNCQTCIEETARSRTPHIISCDEKACDVCASKLAELQSVFRPIYLRALLERPQERDNETLDQYQ